MARVIIIIMSMYLMTASARVLKAERNSRRRSMRPRTSDLRDFIISARQSRQTDAECGKGRAGAARFNSAQSSLSAMVAAHREIEYSAIPCRAESASVDRFIRLAYPLFILAPFLIASGSD